MTQAKDLSEDHVLDAIRYTMRPVGACIWEIQEYLAEYPPKVVRAKLGKMIRAGRLEGCICGCRGDFRIKE